MLPFGLVGRVSGDAVAEVAEDRVEGAFECGFGASRGVLTVAMILRSRGDVGGSRFDRVRPQAGMSPPKGAAGNALKEVEIWRNQECFRS